MLYIYDEDGWIPGTPMEVLGTSRKNLSSETCLMNSMKRTNKRSTYRSKTTFQHHSTTIFNHLVVQPKIYNSTFWNACVSTKDSTLNAIKQYHIDQGYKFFVVELKLDKYVTRCHYNNEFNGTSGPLLEKSNINEK